MSNNSNEHLKLMDWWHKKRILFMLSVVVAGIASFIAYCKIGASYIPSPYFEVTLFSMIFGVISYGVYLFALYHLYDALMYLTSYLNENISYLIFYIYFGLSCIFPFWLPLVIYLSYKDGYPPELMDGIY